MIRLIAFVLALCCCAGLVWGTASALEEQSDDLRYTLRTYLGDPQVLDGRVMTASIQCGDHMRWDTTFTFGEEQWYDTRFHFSQERLEEDWVVEYADLEAYSVTGFGASTTGNLGIRNGGFGELIRTVAAVTPNGQTREMNLRLADYVNYHALFFDLNYRSDRITCSEYVDACDFYIDRWGEGAMLDMDQWLERYAGASYTGFCELFRFPVGEEEIVSVSVSRDERGSIVDVSCNEVSGRDVNFVTAVNDRGVYCIPVFRQEPDSTQAIPGEYAQGMGIYFIPWGLTGEQSEGAAEAKLDTARAENIHPLPEDTVAYGLELTDDGSGAWVLTSEGETFVLSLLDLEGGTVIHRLPVLELSRRQEWEYPIWYRSGDLMTVEVCGTMALVKLDGEPQVELVTELGEAWSGLMNYSPDTGVMWYDGEVLILADTDEYSDGTLEILACGAEGVLFWGDCPCSVFDCNDPGYSPYIQIAGERVTVE